VLPANARGRTIVSLTNTAPLVAPGVVLVHDLAPLVGPQWFVGSMRLYAATVLAAARRARLVVTVSNAVRGELVGHGVAADRIAVVPPAIDDRFAPASSAAVEAVRHAFGLHRPYAVLVGWTNPRKDAATAVAAHRQVARDTPHDLVLVGGPEPTFAPVVLPSLPSVHRLGHVIDQQLVALLTGAAVALYPSRYEGYGLPPLEAMACGTPAVVSDIPALRESAGGLARFAPVGDVAAWAAALADGLAGRLSCPSPPSRSWRTAGQELVAALPS
jgi:glycosyltransferase involved in cell wall biosynthesis